MERVSLADVAGAYVSLRPCGSLLRGLSPFQEERTPSFFVNPTRNVFKCYSSGHGGDAIDFLRLKEGMTFGDAVEFLARKYDFPLEREEGSNSEESPRGLLLAIHERAAALFRETFFGPTAQAHGARLYWTQRRKFSLDCAERYGIGLAPSDWRGEILEKFLRAYPEQALLQSGLFVTPKARPGSILPRFRGRLTFPIEDGLGRTIAFSGRALEGITHPSEAEAKYLNSPETPIFHKHSVLFGLARARPALREGAPFLLTEGPLDCIRCWECGLATAVAAQGTAVTAQHMATLRRHGLEVECLLDGDAAGRAAALRLIPHALRAGLGIRFLPLPDGADPDEYFLREGGEGIRSLREKALSPVELLIGAHLAAGANLSAGKRQAALREILATVAAAQSRTMELELLEELSQKTAIPLDALRADHLRWSPAEKIAESGLRPFGPPVRSGDYLLWLFLYRPDLRPILAERVLPEWLDGDEIGDRLLNHFLGEFENGVGPEEVRETLEESDRAHVCGLLLLPAEGEGEDVSVRLEQCLANLHRRHVTRRLAAFANDDSEEASNLRLKLRRELLHLSS
jgi:DNA primase